VLLGYVVDQTHDDYGLAYAGATEEADFPALQNGWMRSITFTPVSNISAVVDCSSNAGARRLNGISC